MPDVSSEFLKGYTFCGRGNPDPTASVHLEHHYIKINEPSPSGFLTHTSKCDHCGIEWDTDSFYMVMSMNPTT